MHAHTSISVVCSTCVLICLNSAFIVVFHWLQNIIHLTRLLDGISYAKLSKLRRIYVYRSYAMYYKLRTITYMLISLYFFCIYTMFLQYCNLFCLAGFFENGGEWHGEMLEY